MRSNHIAKLDDIVKRRTNMSELNMKAISHREREKDKCPFEIKYQVTKM